MGTCSRRSNKSIRNTQFIKMLLVKTQIKPSEISGIGLFADEDIPKNTIIHKECAFTVEFTKEQLKDLTEYHLEFLKIYSYEFEGITRISVDHDKFMNHSDNPNTYELGSDTLALRDIKKGEEILTDYRIIKCSTHFEDYGE